MAERIVGFVVGLLLGAIGVALSFAVALAFFPPAWISLAILWMSVAAGAILIAVTLSYLIALVLEWRPDFTLGVSVILFILFVLFVRWVVLDYFGPNVLRGALLGSIAITVALAPLFVSKTILVFVGYVIGQTVSYAPTRTPELFARGVNAGLNVAYALPIGWLVYSALFSFVLVPLGAAASAALAAVIARILAAIAVLLVFVISFAGLVASDDEEMKHTLIWTLPWQPAAWFVEGLGAWLFLSGIALHWISRVVTPPNRAFIAIGSIVVRDDFGAIVTTGGVTANLNLIDTAYNLGTFSFIDTFLTPTAARPLSATELHEVGHGLNLAVFGSHFHFIGWFDEGFQELLQRQPVGLGAGGVAAYAERLAEGNVPPAQRVAPPPLLVRPAVRMWLPS